MSRQSLTSQMIDGVFPPKKAKPLSLWKRETPLKICPQCYATWTNAQKICYHCSHQFYGDRKD